MGKLMSIAFQWGRGGTYMVKMGQINEFVQILGLKTPISADIFLDHLPLKGSGTPKLEILSFSRSSLKNIG